MQRTLCCLALLSFASIASVTAAEVELAEAPQVTQAGDKTTIRFAIDKPSDVEIAILNASGTVVRHLAAGFLGGKNPPPPPLKPGLKQSLSWDGKNDAGLPADGGPFQVRVRAGLQVKFGRTIGGSPYTGSVAGMPYRAPVNGLTVDDEGNLYVKMMSSVGSHGNSGMWPWHLRKFDRDGNYIKTILPYPPSTSAENANGFELLKGKGGSFTPANQNSLYPVFSVLGNELGSRLVDGQMLFVHTERRQFNLFALDGSNRIRNFTMWPAEAKLNSARWLDIQMAISLDGRYAYYSNVAGTPYDGKKPDDIDPDWPQGRIYRQDLSQPDQQPQQFFDLELPDFNQHPYWMPSAWDKKTAAAGIDTDADGNVFVCDLVNGQIVEIDPAGKLLSQTDVPWPDKIMVSRQTDALYVVSRKVSRGYLPAAKLYKIVGRGRQAKVVDIVELEGTVGGAYTLDESGRMPVIWLAGGVGRPKSTAKLVRVEDRGGELIVTGDNFLNRDPNAITFAGYLDVDREAELLYVTGNKGNVWRFDGKTGKGSLLEIQAVDIAVGPAGQLYTWGVSSNFQGPIARYTRDLKPIPTPGGEDHTFGFLYGRAGRGTSVCGLDVDADGNVFATYGSNSCHIRAYDKNGKLIDFDRKVTLKTPRGPQQVPVAVAGVVGYGGSIRLDPAGNIYVLQHGLAEDHQPPAGYENDEAYRKAVGTIYKFTPSGGEIKTSGWEIKDVVGAVSRYPGCGPISRWRAAGACACTKPRFDVDDFGRLYIPNGITFSVSVRDNADNEIAHFGAYGNFDSQGPESKQPTPEIPLGWPVAVGAGDRFIYVADTLNHRVVRVDKTFAAESVVPIVK